MGNLLKIDYLSTKICIVYSRLNTVCPYIHSNWAFIRCSYAREDRSKIIRDVEGHALSWPRSIIGRDGARPSAKGKKNDSLGPQRLCHNLEFTKFVILNEVKNLIISMN